MNQQLWKQIDDLVAEALEKPESDRAEFVIAQTADDPELQRQVLDLVKAEKESEQFLQKSAMNLVAKAIAEETTVADHDLIGKTLGVYKIVRHLGAGGMGEVYLAYDEKLKRDIAIKVLPKEYLADDERVKRFATEARAIASLNHPNIVTIYDFESAEGLDYIATEYVEGTTIRELIPEGISLKKSLSLILQCLDALSASHKAGIIHRDIKPENIMVRADGYVKILDFGLAKLIEEKRAPDGSINRTTENAIIGTPAYMSPGQASGEKVDNRTDLWSLALVFYEMLAKKNPFKRENQTATIRAILSKDPPLLGDSNTDLPFEVERILEKALEKDADLRYQTASDFAADLKRVKRETESGFSYRSHSLANTGLNKGNRYGWYASLLLGLAAIGMAIWYSGYLNPDIRGTNWENAKVRQLTSRAGKELFPSLSPDGKTFIYASNEDGDFDIYSRRVGSKKSINLTPTSDSRDTQPTFSRDGNLVAFRSSRKPSGIYTMNITGENLRFVTGFGYHPSWSPDGKQIAVSTRYLERPGARGKSAIWIVDVASGDKRKLVDNYSNQPSWSPNGKRIAYWFTKSGGGSAIATIGIDGGEPEVVPHSANTNWNPVWSPDGRFLYYSSDKNGNTAFWRIGVDQDSGKTLGEPEIVQTPAKFNSHLSFSADGKRLVFVQTNKESNISAAAFDPDSMSVEGAPFSVTDGENEFVRPRLSPDGKKFVSVLAKPTQDDIVVTDSAGNNRNDLTDDKHFDRYPRWSPDGRRVVFTSDRTGVYEIWVMRADGSNLRQVTANEKASSSFPIWSPDGTRLAYYFNFVTYIVDAKPNSEHKVVGTLPAYDAFSYFMWDWSPDGKKIAGIFERKGKRGGIGYFSLETNKYEILTDEAFGFPLWTPNGKGLIFQSKGKVFYIDLKTKKVREVISIPKKEISSVGISRDGKLVYFSVSTSESNIWLLDSLEAGK